MIYPTSLENLWIMPAGSADDRTIHALARPCLKKILSEVRDLYDFVLVDSAPVLAVADSLLLARYVDGVVLSTLRSVSRLPAVYEAYERLTTLNVPVLGVVVNAVGGSYYGMRYYRRTAQAVEEVVAATDVSEGSHAQGTARESTKE